MPQSLPNREVASVAVFRGGKLLWMRRRDDGKLTLPGGHLLDREEPLDAAYRELFEETGLRPDHLEYVGDAPVPGHDLHVWAFRADIEAGEPTAAHDPDHEAASYEWRDPEDCPADDQMHVARNRNVTLDCLGLAHHEDHLHKSERARKEWRSRDGIRIPHQDDPARPAWDAAYHDKLVEVFGAGDPRRLQPVRVPVTPYLSGGNVVRNQDRHRLYQRMLAGGDRLPPPVVRRSGQGWHVIDGNHRADAALRAGVPELDAYELLDADHPSLQKALPPDWGQQGVGSDEGRASGFFWPAALHKPSGAIHLNSEGFHGSSCVPGDDCERLTPEQRQGGADWEDGFVLHPKHRAAHPGKVFFTRDEALQFLKERESRVLAPDWDPYKPGAFAGGLQSTKGLVRKSEFWKAGIEEILQNLERQRARVKQIAATSQASSWRAKTGHTVVVGRDPHARDRWRLTRITPEGEPHGHEVAPSYEAALHRLPDHGVDLHAQPLKMLKAEPDLVAAATASLDDGLRRPKYRGNPNHLAGHCYVASEALYHLMGGPKSGWVPQVIRHEGDTHWYLRHRESGEILDPTAGQFKTPVPYQKGRGSGFLTRDPSKRAQELINRIKSRQALDRRPAGR